MEKAARVEGRMEKTGKLSWKETLAMQAPGKACSAQIPVLSGVLPS